MSQAGLAPILIILLIAIAIGGYLFYQKQFKPVVQSSSIPAASLESSSSDENEDLSSFITTITQAITAFEFTTVIANQDIHSLSCPVGGVCYGVKPGQTITGYKVGRAYSESQLIPKDRYASFLKEYFAFNAPLLIYQPKINNETKIIYYNSVNKSFILFSLQKKTGEWQINYSVYGKTDPVHPIESVSSL